jgi:hypothetical protein
MSGRSSHLEDDVRIIAREAVRSGRLPVEVASYAEAVTIAALGSSSGPVSRRRARAYFDAVARRRLLRWHSGSPAAARVIIDAVVADLSASGRSGPDIWDEILRGWCDRLPSELVDEYRVRLCA